MLEYLKNNIHQKVLTYLSPKPVKKNESSLKRIMTSAPAKMQPGEMKPNPMDESRNKK